MQPTSSPPPRCQDVYLRLSSSSACCGIVRLRTSPHFKVVRHYGRLFPDPTIPDLHHIIAADPSDAFAGARGAGRGMGRRRGGGGEGCWGAGEEVWVEGLVRGWLGRERRGPWPAGERRRCG